jgi:hypothetical protein
MMKVKSTNKVPENSIISKDFNETDYCDTFAIITQNDDGLDKITTDIFQTPKWADRLMSIRNIVVKIFGLKGGGRKIDTHSSDYYPIGSKAVYFTVIDRNDNEILMAENDKHLNFRISVMVNREGKDVTISLTTIVKFNNFLGRLYFLTVRPFHRIIVISLLKRLLKKQK